VKSWPQENERVLLENRHEDQVLEKNQAGDLVQRGVQKDDVKSFYFFLYFFSYFFI